MKFRSRISLLFLQIFLYSFHLFGNKLRVKVSRSRNLHSRKSYLYPGIQWDISRARGVTRNFSTKGFWKFFVWKEKFRRGFRIFFSKNPSKLKKFSRRGDPQNPPWIRPCPEPKVISNFVWRSWLDFIQNQD